MNRQNPRGRWKRRDFLKSAVGLGAAASFLGKAGRFAPEDVSAWKYGPLQPDPKGVMDLPKGFRYHMFSLAGETMDDGFLVPGAQDGMAAFPGENGTTLLVRNHELVPADRRPDAFDHNVKAFRELDETLRYDGGKGRAVVSGGTSTLVYDTAKKQLLKHHLSLTGTIRNCAGGRTPWGTWISCEEALDMPNFMLDQQHGYCFEVDPRAGKLSPPRRLDGLGRFRHEAVAIDPRSGIVYLTEDHSDGLLYRFIPKAPRELTAGGRLQALKIEGKPGVSTANRSDMGADRFALGESHRVSWVDMEDIHDPANDLRLRGRKAGAAAFCRGEGIDYDQGQVFVACTSGGSQGVGHVWRYTPDGERGEGDGGSLTLICEPDDPKLMCKIDNICVAPSGDLILAEDGGHPPNRILGLTPEGEIYPIAANVQNSAEVAGCTWSADGSTLFFNIFHPGATLAVQGSWR